MQSLSKGRRIPIIVMAKWGFCIGGGLLERHKNCRRWVFDRLGRRVGRDEGRPRIIQTRARPLRFERIIELTILGIFFAIKGSQVAAVFMEDDIRT